MNFYWHLLKTFKRNVLGIINVPDSSIINTVATDGDPITPNTGPLSSSVKLSRSSRTSSVETITKVFST